MAELQARLREDQVLQVFGETVIIRRDPGSGQPLDGAVIEEIVPPGVGAPLHRHSREDEISYVIEGTFRIWPSRKYSMSVRVASPSCHATRCTRSATSVPIPDGS